MRRLTIVIAGLAMAALVVPPSSGTAVAGPSQPRPLTTVVAYDTFQDADGYTETDYLAKWDNSYGPGELAAGGTRIFGDGTLRVNATPFRTGVDFSVFDHLKYIALSKRTFPVPATGSVTFSIDIAAETPGVQPGRAVHGTYITSGAPYSAPLLDAQQASVSLHMVDFATGQLFDWLVSGNKAVTLVERLPIEVTGSAGAATRETMYTQIVDEVAITPGVHNYAITYTRDNDGSSAAWYLDGKLVSKVHKVGIPLDVQGKPYTGIYPSMGLGELLNDEVNSLTIAHGLISLLDAFPFQHPSAPELSVSVPMSERLFGQGARATYDNVYVRTVSK